jgi:hypothetical protein
MFLPKKLKLSSHCACSWSKNNKKLRNSEMRSSLRFAQ